MRVAFVEYIILTLEELGDVDSILTNSIDDLTIHQTNPCVVDSCRYTAIIQISNQKLCNPVFTEYYRVTITLATDRINKLILY